MSMSDIISVLGRDQCPDITNRLDLGRCGCAPVSTTGASDIYRGMFDGGEEVTIKCARLYVQPENADGSKILKRAARELYIWSRLKHKNVLELLGIAQFRDQLAMVSPWVGNGTLLQYIRSNPAADRFQLTLDICEGTAFLHQNNIVHGDIKSENVLVAQDGVAKLVNFSCTDLKAGNSYFTTPQDSLSIRWASPEIMTGAVVLSKEADVYALGMTLLEAITGAVPFNSQSDLAVFNAVVVQGLKPRRPEDLTSFDENQVDLLWTILLDTWAYNPTDRPDSLSVQNRMSTLKNAKSYAKSVSLSSSICGIRGSDERLRFELGSTNLIDHDGDSKPNFESKKAAFTCNRNQPGEIWPQEGKFMQRFERTTTGGTAEIFANNRSHSQEQSESEQHISLYKPIAGGHIGETVEFNYTGTRYFVVSHNIYSYDMFYTIYQLDEKANLVFLDGLVTNPPLPGTTFVIKGVLFQLDYDMKLLRQLNGRWSDERTYEALADAYTVMSLESSLSRSLDTTATLHKPSYTGILYSTSALSKNRVQSAIHSPYPEFEDPKILPLSSEMPVHTVIDVLIQDGCFDVTDQLDLVRCENAPISDGGFADIYKGMMSSGELVAIKCPRLYLQRDRDGGNILKHVARELYTWSRLKHSNVLELLGLARFQNHVAMVVPWMSNRTLLEYVNHNPNVNRHQLGLEISESISYIHQSNVIHGDIKGANILISGEGVPKLTDFGCSLLKSDSLSFTTTTGGASHSTRWAAPEILAGDTGQSKEADVYALGMTLLELVTGLVPFSRLQPDMAVITAVVTNKRIPERPNVLTSFGNRGADLLWEIMIDSWSHDPSDRPDAPTIRDRIREIPIGGIAAKNRMIAYAIE